MFPSRWRAGVAVALGVVVGWTVSGVTGAKQIEVIDNTARKRDESNWGRLYMNQGLDHIQYFKAQYGGKIPNVESILHFPTNELGCTPFEENEAEKFRENPGFIVLDRGLCTFDVKTGHAEDAGALGVILVSHTEDIMSPYANPIREHQIPTVMIRSSGGRMLRRAAEREEVFGRLVPIVCEKETEKMKSCAPVSEKEVMYINENLALSGTLHDSNDVLLGEFLTASFGAPLPRKKYALATTGSEDACLPLNMDLSDRAVLVPRGGCSILDKVKNIQEAGGFMAIIVAHDATMTQPIVNNRWEGYNVTIPSIMISKNLGDMLETLIDSSRGMVSFQVNNQVAEAWEKIHEYADLAKWPSKKSRREKLIRKLLDDNKISEARSETIKKYFVDIAGGSHALLQQFERATTHEEM